MKYGWAIAGIALAVSGCGGPGSGKAQTRSSSGQPPAAASLPAPSSSQQCDAPALAYLVGRPKTDIPVPVDPSQRRVACTTCTPATDYRPDRTEILFDAKTGLVTAVRCK